MADLRDQFNAIDVDKNGTISLEEMKHVSLLPFLGLYLYAHRLTLESRYFLISVINILYRLWHICPERV